MSSKKIFTSLVLGFGATLAVLVAVAMPPGSWAVVVGVLLGLLACIPMLGVVLLMRSNNSSSKSTQQPIQPIQPIIVVQTPQGYTLPNGNYAQPQYFIPDGYETYEYTQPQQTRQNRSRRALPKQQRYADDTAYYYEETYPQTNYQYDTADYYTSDAYSNTQPDYTAYELEEWEKPYPKAKGSNRRRNREMTVDAEFRTMGD